MPRVFGYSPAWDLPAAYETVGGAVTRAAAARMTAAAEAERQNQAEALRQESNQIENIRDQSPSSIAASHTRPPDVAVRSDIVRPSENAVRLDNDTINNNNNNDHVPRRDDSLPSPPLNPTLPMDTLARDASSPERNETTTTTTTTRTDQIRFIIDATENKKFRNVAKAWSFMPTTQDLNYEFMIRSLVRQVESFVESYRTHRARTDYKAHLSIRVRFSVIKNNVLVEQVSFWYDAKSILLLAGEPIDGLFDGIRERLTQCVSDMRERGSGFVFDLLEKGVLSLVINQPNRGGCFQQLPKSLSQKHATLNIKTVDGYCILDCISYVKDPVSIDPQNPQNYLQKREQINTGALTFPLKLSQVEQLEALNPDLSICVYGFEKLPARFAQRRKKKYVDGYRFFPLKISKRRDEKLIQVNLLYLKKGQEEVGHYVVITDLTRLIKRAMSYSHRKVFTCRYCLGGYSSAKKVQFHRELCQEFKPVVTQMPMAGQNDVLKFNDPCAAMEVQWSIIFDFETYERCEQGPSAKQESPLPTDAPTTFPWVTLASEEAHLKNCSRCSLIRPCDSLQRSTQQECALQAFSYAYLICSYDNQDTFPIRYNQSENVSESFLISLKKDMAMLYEKQRENQSFVMTQEEQSAFDAATECYLCKKQFKDSRDKHRHHRHDRGVYCYPLCFACNSRLFQRKVNILSHNMSGMNNAVSHPIVPEK